jgi:hypothetical protein
MAEMSVAIMVVSLPAMRSFLKRGSLFSSSHKKLYAYGSASHQGAASQDFKGYGRRGKNITSVRIGDDEGSQVELNDLTRSDVIYETRRVSVQYDKERW